MQEIQYKKFSWNTHKKNWRVKNPNICQFELTFKCGLHCKHCYTDCYNSVCNSGKELKTEEVKYILDKVYKAGVIWLCFTGGDPLTRDDFLELYSYAKDKGFIITIFTNGYSMTRKIADYLKKRPPFVIELTLNAVTKDVYERISQVKGSFEKTIKGLNLILKAKLPLKVKTQITKDNLRELPEIKRFIKGLGLRFRLAFDLHARLNGDLTPCNLRISSQEVLSLNGDKQLSVDDCQFSPITEYLKPNTDLFRCAIGGGDRINIDPDGNMFLCNSIRDPVFNLLKVDVEYAQNRLLSLVREKKFTTDSRCKDCGLREFCLWCPGKAYLETDSMEAPIEYYCEIARAQAEVLSLKK